VALDPEGRQDFRGLLARRGNLHYAAFDVLWLNGKDLRGLPLTRRRRALERVIPATTTVFSRVFAVEGRGRDLFAAAERLDLEGIVGSSPRSIRIDESGTARALAPDCVTMLTLFSYSLCYSCGLESFLSLNSEGAPHGTSYCRI